MYKDMNNIMILKILKIRKAFNFKIIYHKLGQCY